MSVQPHPTPPAPFLTEQERCTVRALAEVLIEDTDRIIPLDDVMQNIDRYLARVDSSRKRSLRLTLFLIEYVLPRRSWWPFRPPFSQMSLTDRKQFVDHHLKNPHKHGVLRDLAKIKSLFIIGYYGDTRVHDSIHFTPVAERPKYTRAMLRPVGLPRVTVTQPDGPELVCDVCVIGSGAGGAVVAYNTAAAGKDVVLLEEGSYVPPEEMNHHEWEMMPRLYKEGGLQSTVDMDMTILQGQVLGGSTTVNNAICFRLNDPGITPQDGPDLLERWERLGVRLHRDGLEAAFDRVEKMLGVRPLLDAQEADLPPISGNNARLLLDGWADLTERDPSLRRYKSGLFEKNINRCLGCGYCNFGCPYERKMAMSETYIPAAVKHGARVVTDCHAVRIAHEDGRAVGVQCEMGDGRSLFVRARSVVVSGGAIGSSVLLMKSGIRRNVGSRFSFNAGLPVFALFPQTVNGFDGVQMGAYIDRTDYLLESLFYPPMGFASIMPGWTVKRMQAYHRFACAGVLIGTEPSGFVKQSGLLRSLFGPVAYLMTPGDLAKMKRGVAELAQIFFAAGAERVMPAAFINCELDAARFAGHPDDILSFINGRIRRQEDLTLGSAHPQGGNPMSDDPSLGVVDSQFRVHGFQNLFVCDASVFPTSIRINPQLTIMAMADYFVHLGLL